MSYTEDDVTAYTDDDVAAGLKAIGGVWGVDIRMDVQDVLAAVAPAIAARAVAEAEARWAAEVAETKRLLHERARAEQVSD